MTDTRGVTTAATDDWRQRAACKDVESDLFFPIGDTGPARLQIAEAQAVCARCDVAVTCLQWALDTDQRHGIWAGTTEAERERARVRRRRNPNAPKQHGTVSMYNAGPCRCGACVAAKSAYQRKYWARTKVSGDQRQAGRSEEGATA